MKLLLFLFYVLVTANAGAFIPRSLLILQKTSDSSGSGSYQIDQEVQFQTLQEPLVLKETWWVDNENSMRLLVVGTKEFKDQIRMSFVFSGGQRTSMISSSRQSKKLTEEFVEKYFHFRGSEAFANALIQMKIVPSSIFVKKPVKMTKDKEIEYTPETFVRLGRVGGVIAYAFGSPSEPDSSETFPGIWIEQDQFVIRKIRFPSGAEVSADGYSSYPRGLMFPRKRTVRWDNNSVLIQTLSISTKSRPTSAHLEPSKLEGLDGHPVKTVIEEFYKRFR